MPFTIGGEWIDATPSHTKQKQAIKISKEKKKNTIVTVILHLAMNELEIKNLCSLLKKQLACGGSVKENKIELQGDHVENVIKFLQTKYN